MLELRHGSSAPYVHFFLCKQKTAYELRISDWSSDVCSSDLYLTLAARLLGDNGASFADAWNFGPEPQAFLNVETLARTLCDAWGAGAPPLRLGVGGGPHEAEIGRASCRERVCQYV